MFEDKDAPWIRTPPRSSSRTPSTTPHSIELWCLQKDTDQVRGVAMETPFGYALGIDIALVLTFHQPDLECLIAAADRIEATFLAKGWQAIQEHGARKEDV